MTNKNKALVFFYSPPLMGLILIILKFKLDLTMPWGIILTISFFNIIFGLIAISIIFLMILYWLFFDIKSYDEIQDLIKKTKEKNNF